MADHFADRLVAAQKAIGNAVVVGIDPRLEELPEGLVAGGGVDRAGLAEAIGEFGCGVVEAVAGIVPAVKIQAAFYEAIGAEGMAALDRTARFAREWGLIVLIDGKRNDIGSTAEAYARAYLGGGAAAWEADALTVNPYLGSDGIRPFVAEAGRSGRGLFVLVRTSNPSAGEFQDLVADGRPVYRHVAERLSEWAAPHRGECGYSLVGAVAGATYPAQLAELRAALPGVILLVPGYGAQGATARDVAAAFDDEGLGALINSSRGIAGAFRRPEARARFGDDWKAAIAAAARAMADDLAAQTPAGRLRR